MPSFDELVNSILMNENPMTGFVLNPNAIKLNREKYTLNYFKNNSMNIEYPFDMGLTLQMIPDTNDHQLIAGLFNNNSELCFLTILDWFSFNNKCSYKVVFSNKYINIGSNISLKLYVKLVELNSCALFSDSKVSEGGKKIWINLIQNYNNLNKQGIKVFGYYVKDKKIFDVLKMEPQKYFHPDDEFFKDILIGIEQK